MSDANDQHLIGFTIGGKYAIRRVIGVGGVGAVYEGVHTEIGKRVAIKVISGALAHSGEVAARFRREARAASAVIAQTTTTHARYVAANRNGETATSPIPSMARNSSAGPATMKPSSLTARPAPSLK